MDDPYEQAAKDMRDLIDAKKEFEQSVAAKGMLRPAGESCDPPSKRATILIKATTESYPTLISRPGWVLAIYTRDQNWVLNALYGRAKTYQSPKPKYDLPESLFTTARKLVRESNGTLTGVIVDTSRCNNVFTPDGISPGEHFRLFLNGKLTADYRLDLYPGAGPAAVQLRTWVAKTMRDRH